MKILWSEFASEQLNEIFEYYSFRTNSEIAIKIIEDLVGATSVLINNPHLGIPYQPLKSRSLIYRILIWKSYKIVYTIDSKNEIVKISDIFNSHQNPLKLKRNK